MQWLNWRVPCTQGSFPPIAKSLGTKLYSDRLHKGSNMSCTYIHVHGRYSNYIYHHNMQLLMTHDQMAFSTV